MKRLGMVLLGLMFWSMNTLAQYATRPSDPDEDCYIGKANAYGRYSELVQRLDCHDDHERYGKGREYYDDEYWHGGEHCGNKGMNGYWVYVSPTWFVWEQRTDWDGQRDMWSSSVEEAWCQGYESREEFMKRTGVYFCSKWSAICRHESIGNCSLDSIGRLFNCIYRAAWE